MQKRSSLGLFAALAAFYIGAVGCSDGTGPRADVAGTYWAGAPSPGSSVVGTFTTTQNGVTTDRLESGGSIRLLLLENGRTNGRLLIPGEIDADLSGTWTLEGRIVQLSHPEDTFLRDMGFHVEDGQLEAEDVFAGVTVHVVLRRVP